MRYHKLLKAQSQMLRINFGLSSSDLYISKATADEGPTLKRFRPRARGRAGRINKRTSHLVIELTTADGEL